MIDKLAGAFILHTCLIVYVGKVLKNGIVWSRGTKAFDTYYKISLQNGHTYLQLQQQLMRALVPSHPQQQRVTRFFKI